MIVQHVNLFVFYIILKDLVVKLSQLYRELDCGYIDQSEFKIVYVIASGYRKQIKDFRRYFRNYKRD
jgi:hypothetical protein